MGTGYTRTNTADIQADEIVKSAPINAEFNAVLNELEMKYDDGKWWPAGVTATDRSILFGTHDVLCASQLTRTCWLASST